jgi:hypothetical protein
MKYWLVMMGVSVLFAGCASDMANKRTNTNNDLKECLKRVSKVLPAADFKKVKEMSDPSGMFDYHFSVGLWIRNYCLQRNTPLYNDFIAYGVDIKDDMSGIVLVAFWRQLHGKKIDMEDLIKEMALKGLTLPTSF